MWKATCAQSNTLDLTIQCQLNMASRNTLEVSSVFANPAEPHVNAFTTPCNVNSGRQQPEARFSGFTGASPSHQFTSCEFAKSQTQGSHVITDHVLGENSLGGKSTFEPMNPTFKQCNVNSSYNSDYLDLLTSVFDPAKRQSPPSYGLHLNDSGYGSPGLTGGQCHRSQPPVSPSFASNQFRASMSPVFPACNEINDQRLYHPANYTIPEMLPPRKENSSYTAESPNDEVKLAMRERDVSQRLYNLKCQESTRISASEIEQFHQSQISIVDFERHNVLCQVQYDITSIDSVNTYYNLKLVSVLASTEDKLTSLEKTIKCKSGKSQTKKGRMLPKVAVKVLDSWYNENLSNPYPSREVTLKMAKEGGITVEQIRKWFANKRNRSRNNKLKNLGNDTTEGSS